MELKTFFDLYPRGARGVARKRLAQAHGVSEVTIRAWANGTRRHPCTRKAINVTEIATGFKVTRHDLRPDIFGEEAEKGVVIDINVNKDARRWRD